MYIHTHPAATVLSLSPLPGEELDFNPPFVWTPKPVHMVPDLLWFKLVS